MDKVHAFATIDRATFIGLLKQYPRVLPPKLTELDKQRYETIPATLRQRTKAKDAYLSKEEVATLINWKLSHGRFRPTLKVLFQENSDKVVVDTTREAFAAFKSPSADDAKRSIEILATLRGIGPATASLLLSVYDPEIVPFFSVGLFGWSTNKKGHGREWEKGIKYNLKEYLTLYAETQAFRERLKVSAAEAEKVGYVVGKTIVAPGKATTDQDGQSSKASARKRKVHPDEEARADNGSARKSARNTRSKKQT